MKLGVLAAGLGFVVLAAPAYAQAAPPAAEQPAFPSIAYQVDFRAPADVNLAERIRRELQIEQKRAAGAATVGVLESRVERDVARAMQVMKAFGFYDGQATGSVEPGPPVVARLAVEEGPLYRIRRYDLAWRGAAPDVALDPVEAVGEAASGRNIVGAEDRILAQLRRNGHYDARMSNRRVVLDRDARVVDVTLEIEAGPLVSISGFSVSGAETLPDERVVRLSKLQVGDLITTDALKTAEDKLLSSGLFNQARLAPVGTTPARPVAFTVVERLPRTVSGALKWSLQDGFAAEAAWEHRNFFGDAEKMRAALTYGQQKQGLEVSYRQYDTLFEGHTLLATLDVSREDVDGLRYQQAALIGTLETELWDDLILRYGGSLEYVRDESRAHGGDYALIGLRAEASYDKANDLLDPTEGYRVTVRVLPYLGWNDDMRNFYIFEALGSAYLPLDEARDWVAAGRIRLGAIAGDERDDIPLPKRFFAGGGGSIRGYSYKRAGPIDADDRPIGGASVIELNAEMRYRINEEFGAVAFVDAGGAYEDHVPWDGDFFVGAGLGVRYYSPIGPVRLDVAAPLNKREGDPGVQIYVSIGQAF